MGVVKPKRQFVTLSFTEEVEYEIEIELPPEAPEVGSSSARLIELGEWLEDEESNGEARWFKLLELAEPDWPNTAKTLNIVNRALTDFEVREDMEVEPDTKEGEP